MKNEIPVPIAVVETVDRFIGDEFRDAAKFSNREVLDDSGSYSLHGVAAEVYARGYQDGRMAERQRANGERQRERDRARAAAQSIDPSPEVVEPCPTCGIETLEQDQPNGSEA